MNSFFELLKDYDIFGIEPNLYYEKRTKKYLGLEFLFQYYIYLFI